MFSKNILFYVSIGLFFFGLTGYKPVYCMTGSDGAATSVCVDREKMGTVELVTSFAKAKPLVVITSADVAPVTSSFEVAYNLVMTLLLQDDAEDARMTRMFEHEGSVFKIGPGAFLRGARLSSAELEYVHLQRADLMFARLERANLTWANLKEAKLQGAHLEKACLEMTHFENASLESAHLNSANLTGTNFECANLTNADLTNAFGLRTAKVYRAVFIDVLGLSPEDIDWLKDNGATVEKVYLDVTPAEKAATGRLSLLTPTSDWAWRFSGW